MKYPILSVLCGLLVFTGCTVRSGKFTDTEFSTANKAIIQYRDLDATEKSIAASDKAIFEKVAKEQIEDAKKKWPSFTEREIIAILQKQIFIGMSKDAMIVSWGKPKKNNSSVKKLRKIEQYIYPGKTMEFEVYVYVEKKHITGWQK